MAHLTAIDILINPDEAMLDQAKAWNERLLESIPSPPGFELDKHHTPHITTLHRYVITSDLDKVFAAVQGVLSEFDVAGLKFTGARILHMEESALPGVGLAAIQCQPSPEVLDYQAKLIAALKPYTASGGTAEAFLRSKAEPDINQDTLYYVEHYVPEHSGKNFNAHVTIGLAKLEDLEKIEAEPFESFTFSTAGVSVYQLGNNGTAAKHLKSLSV